VFDRSHRPPATADGQTFQLRFHPLVGEANEFTCPCNATGHVVMDQMSERARSSYLFARAMVGRLYAPPEITAEVRREVDFA
jgi:hypothetical protein